MRVKARTKTGTKIRTKKDPAPRANKALAQVWQIAISSPRDEEARPVRNTPHMPPALLVHDLAEAVQILACMRNRPRKDVIQSLKVALTIVYALGYGDARRHGRLNKA